MLNLSPIGMEYITKCQNNLNEPNLKAPLANKTSDSFISKNPKKTIQNKKVLIAAIGVMAAVAGGILITKRNSTKAILNKAKDVLNEAECIKTNAQKIQSESNEVLQKGNEIFKQASDVIEEAKMNNFEDVKDEAGNTIRKFITKQTDKWKTADTMIEFANDGTKKRVVTICNNTPETIEDFMDKTKYVYNNGELNSVFKGCEELIDDTFSAEKVFGYNCAKLNMYGEKYIENAQGIKNYDKMYIFSPSDDKLCDYMEKIQYQDLNSNIYKCAAQFTFEHDRLSNFAKNYEMRENNCCKAQKIFGFNENKLVTYCKDYAQDASGNENYTKQFLFDENEKLIKKVKTANENVSYQDYDDIYTNLEDEFEPIDD